MLRYFLGAWAVAGVLIAGLLTAVAQNPPPLAGSRGETSPRTTTGRDLEIQFRMTTGGALEIASLDRRGPAYESGLREGDQIVSVGGRTIQMEQALRQFLRETSQDPIPVVVLRNGRQERILLASREPPDRQEPPPIGAHSRATIGARLTDSPVGVRIAELAPAGPAARAGLRVGDVIVRLEGRRYADAAELAGVVARAPVALPLVLEVMRNGVISRMQVRPESYAAIYGRQPLAEPAQPAQPPPPEERQRLAARPEFDLAHRIQQLEAQIATLHEEVQALRGRVDALLADRPSGQRPATTDATTTDALEHLAPPRDSARIRNEEEVPEPPRGTAAPSDLDQPAERDDVLPAPPDDPQE